MKFHHLLLGAAAAIAFSATVSAADSKDVVYDGVDLEPSGNPIFTDAWTCDPAPLVVGDRLYVYTGEDIYKDGENIGLPGNYNIADWRVSRQSLLSAYRRWAQCAGTDCSPPSC